MNPAPELVLEPQERRLSDRRFGLVVFGVALAVAAVAGSFILLPRGFGLLLLIVIAYPAIQILRGARAARKATGPRLVIGPTALQAATLRFAWRDVTDVGVGPSARVRDRRDRVKIRLNRLVPVRPTDAALRAAGLELGDQYFDFAIPPGYVSGPSEIAAEIERRRTQVRLASAALRATPPAQAPPPDSTAVGQARRKPGSRPGGAGGARSRPPAPGSG